LKLGIDVSQATVAKYRVRIPGPPSQSWRTFLDNHMSQLASVDFFTVPTVWFEVLFVFVVLAHDRRRVLHFNVTAHPTATWTAQQILEAFPFEAAPKVSPSGSRCHLWTRASATNRSSGALRKYSELPDHPGNGPMSNESSARFAATASTT